MSISVSIVEDDADVRDNMALLIESAPGFRCVSTHPSAEDALEKLPKVVPEVALMDINLVNLNGIECVRRLKPLLPRTQIIMLTVYQDTENIFNALAAGATGYMLKQTPPTELLNAIKEVHSGGSPMSGHIARKIVEAFQTPAPSSNEGGTLTARESQILELLAKGFLYKEIAEATGVTFATVRSHLRNIYEKLHVRTRSEAIAKHLGHAPAFARPPGR